MVDDAERLLSYALVVTRDPAIAAEAVSDALVVAAHREEPADRVPWLLALVRSECLRQLRARSQFADTPGIVDAAAGDPFDGLTAGERDALALALRDDIDREQVMRILGCSLGVARSRVEKAQRAWTDIARALLLVRDAPDCDRLDHLAAECIDDTGALRRSGWRRIAEHTRACPVCREAVTPLLAEAVRDLSLPSAVPSGEVAVRAAARITDPELAHRLVERAAPWREDGYPIPYEDGADPRSWARRAAMLTAISAALLVIAVMVVALTSR